ncbi:MULTISPECIES: S28 family serine protease [unclassified Streptomyces]|uniref:S28 family serine protease n=1 Tax=unclassified Streptomyces TaxID=2593676 RepID=UPI000DB9FDB9|nr:MULTISPECIES: S28 family serine protease [unclassified Streptomyces]MYT71427.1 aminopeptidase [Streptomyces sp. SID8367]RAJ82888.1 PS-10 peptidase S37 [Streptomyces sp. PsTaAH-137]
MRKVLRWLLSLVVLIGTVAAAGTTTATAAADATDIKDRLLAVPGISLVEEKPYDGYRYFVLNFTQPVDHRHPSKGTFQQRITVLHKDVSRPTVMFTSGYNVSTTPSRSEPTRIVDGNQVSVEYRFFTPSRPQPADWSKLDIWQAASDQHRIYQALKPVYGANWLTTGGSKGGMTATYYERFYPRDMDGVVAYVAPNDVVNDEDSAYDRFLANVGPKDCRVALQKVQRETLVRRTALEKKYADYLAANNYTVTTVGSLDKAYEATVLDLVWGFWQYQPESACADVPDAATVTDQALFDYVDAVGGWSSYADQGLERYTPYYYQAGTQLGSPDIKQPWLGKLSRYGYQPPRNFVPRSISMKFDKRAMPDVDAWVRHHATRMLYVYGDNDPWGAERFRLGKGARDSYVLTAPHANHGANVAALTAGDKELATQRILAWAGLSGTTAKAPHDAGLDRTGPARELTLRP